MSFQVMGVILLVILVLLGLSLVRAGGEDADDEWRPQSQLQMSRRQSDLYDEMNLGNRHMHRSLPPGASTDEAGPTPPRRNPGLGRPVADADAADDADEVDDVGEEDDAADKAELAQMVHREQMAKLFGSAQQMDEDDEGEDDDADDDAGNTGIEADMGSDLLPMLEYGDAGSFMSLYHAIFDSDDDMAHGAGGGGSAYVRMRICAMNVDSLFFRMTV